MARKISKKPKGAKRKPPNRGSNPGKLGQPTIFSVALGASICEQISSGKSLRAICRQQGMPVIHTILRWIFDEDKTDFRKAYELAREIQAELIFEETKEIADTSQKVIVGDDRSDGARVQAVKLSVDTRKWFLARMAPKKFGEKIDVTTGGKKIIEPRRAIINYVIPKEPKAK